MDIVSSFAIPVIVKSKKLKDLYLEKFFNAKIEVRPMIAGNMNTQPFFKKYINEDFNLKNTQFLHENSFYCGNNPELNSEDINQIKIALTK